MVVRLSYLRAISAGALQDFGCCNSYTCTQPIVLEHSTELDLPSVLTKKVNTRKNQISYDLCR